MRNIYEFYYNLVTKTKSGSRPIFLNYPFNTPKSDQINNKMRNAIYFGTFRLNLPTWLLHPGKFLFEQFELYFEVAKGYEYLKPMVFEVCFNW